MFSRRFHRNSQMFLSNKICVNLRDLWEIFGYADYANCRSYSFLYTKKALM